MEHRCGTVAVVGAPNVGKSTLLNALLGQKIAIVSPKPQTTRRNLLGVLTEPGYQIAFVDTPGVSHPKHLLGARMAQAAHQALLSADVVMLVTDVSRLPGEFDWRVAKMLARVDGAKLLVLNKMDRLPPEKVQRHCDAHWALLPECPWMMISARKRDNLDRLLALLVPLLPEGPPLYPEDQVTDAPMRFLAAELVREQVLLRTRQEVPHSTAVLTETWEERPDGPVYIGATVYVERDAHKAIVLGKGGQMLKSIGASARKGIEEMLQRPVYLDLWVKVKQGWRERPGTLHELGLD